MAVDRERPRQYGVNAHDRAPLIQFMLDALRRERCRIIHEPSPDRAPFRVTFETPQGERMGIMVYAFLATFTPTRNRPDDEHSFQIKYGTKDGKLHDIWQDPYDLYTTLFLGINPEQGFFVAADPVLHSPTRFFIRLEFKQRHVDEILRRGWFAWERQRLKPGEPVEVLVGGKASSFLRLIRFEREARAEDQGHRQLLAEQVAMPDVDLVPPTPALIVPSPPRLHELARELELSETEVLDVIVGARRLKMAVRGWVAEEHLVRTLKKVPGVSECERPDEEGGIDVRLRYQGSRPISIECKNVLRDRSAAGLARLDFQRTRASKSDPCSRYYSPRDFDVVAACLHAVTLRWEFQYAATRDLDRVPPPKPCAGKLSHLVKLDDRWARPIRAVLEDVAKG